MATTTNKGLRYPVLADNPDVPRDIGNLAADLDRVLNWDVGLLASRPAIGSTKRGDAYWATDDTTMGTSGTPYVSSGPAGAWLLWSGAASPAAGTVGLRKLGTGATDAAAGNDSRLSDARTPLAHAASHRQGGSDELGHAALSAAAISETGLSGQVRAGRVLTLADFTTLLGLNAPVGLYDLSTLNDLSGGSRTLVNATAVTLTANSGVLGTDTCAKFNGTTGLTGSYLYNTANQASFQIRSGTVGCWVRCSNNSANQMLISKDDAAGASGRSYALFIAATTGVPTFQISPGGTTMITLAGTSNLADDRWHFVVATYDGAMLRIFVDGNLDAETVLSGQAGGPIAITGTRSFCIGGRGGDNATAGTNLLYGRLQSAFVTADILTEDQVRLLMAAKVAHGYATTPNQVDLMVKRRRRGAPLVIGDFPATPRRLYNFTAGALTDAGLDGATLTNLNNAPVAAGADGTQNGAFQCLSNASQRLTATDTGVLNQIGSCGGWFNAAAGQASQIMIFYGSGAAKRQLWYNAAGGLEGNDGNTAFTVGISPDGRWHHIVWVYTTSAIDGFNKSVIYYDGRIVGAFNATPVTITGGGASAFAINGSASGSHLHGEADAVFVTDYALTSEQVWALYNKSAVVLPSAPADPYSMVEGIDSTNLYLINDVLDSNSLIDLKVAA